MSALLKNGDQNMSNKAFGKINTIAHLVGLKFIYHPQEKFTKVPRAIIQ